VPRVADDVTRTLDIPPDVKDACHVRNDVRQRRSERGLSQAELGDALGVSRQTMNSIEAGRWLPSLPLAMALARFFGCSVEEVFHDDDE
jgi:putative transcriptional regulator